MKKKPIKKEISLSEIQSVPVKVVSNASMAAMGVGEGRNIPLIIIDSSDRPDIKNLFENHEQSIKGESRAYWNIIGNKVALLLEFLSPVDCKFIIEMDVVKMGPVINLIFKSQSLYIQQGKPGDRLKNNINLPKIIIDVHCQDFKSTWDELFLKKMKLHFKRKYKVSKKEAGKMAMRYIREFEKVENIRI